MKINDIKRLKKVNNNSKILFGIGGSKRWIKRKDSH